MRKLLFLLAVSLIFVSCKLIPEIEGSYPKDSLSERSRNQEKTGTIPETEQGKDTPPSSDKSTESAESSEPAESPEDLSMEEQSEEPAAFPDPTLELAETDYPAEVPEETALAVTEEPIAQQPPVQPQPPPQPAPPPQQQQVTPPPPPPDPPPQEIVPPAVVQEQPPPESTEDESPPPPERATPSYTIPDMPFQPVTAIPDLSEDHLPYSRTVRALVGQYIEIPFRGSGWVYLGEFGSRRGVSYDSRRMDQEGMIFIFRADAEGTYSLKFNRHDFVRDSILNDYVKVIVEQRPITSGSSWSNSQIGPDRVYAEPRWPPATDPEGRSAQGQTAGTAAAQQAADTQQTGAVSTTQTGAVQTGAAPTGSVSADSTLADGALQDAAAADTAAPLTEDWLKKAREEYNAGRIKNALDALDQFMGMYPSGSDEAFWLYGQSLEANNEATRDIRLSLDYYRRLTREFPQSSRYDEARQRIAYLERFYFSIQ